MQNFYRTVVVQANVHLSFASRLRGLNPTSKARAIKQLLVSKFDRKRFSRITVTISSAIHLRTLIAVRPSLE